jgi:hypothetical protein
MCPSLDARGFSMTLMTQGCPRDRHRPTAARCRAHARAPSPAAHCAEYAASRTFRRSFC